MHERDDQSAGVAAIYCPACRGRRAVEDWRGHGDRLIVTLAPCGHVVERDARLEWRVPTRAEARAARLMARGGGRDRCRVITA